MILAACLLMTAAVVAAFRTGRAAVLPPAFTVAAALLAASLPGDPVSKFSDKGGSAMPADPLERLRLTLSRYGYRVQSNLILKYEGHVATIWGGCRSLRHAAERVAEKTDRPEVKAALAAALEDCE